tara:strand:- start:48 stop:671 length:624 start_codon:yes stop_codon:yes gene_type:complete
MFTLSRNGFEIEKHSIGLDTLRDIKNDLTVKPFNMNDYGINVPTKFKVYSESPTKIYIPRFYGINRFKSPDIINFGEPVSINVKFNGSLREEQKPIFEIIQNEFHKNGGSIISLKCGGGKTVLALWVVSYFKLKTIVIVHKDFLMTQWYDRIKEFIPNARIGKIQQNTIDIENKDIVLAMVQSLSMKEYYDSTFSTFGLAIFDECHH